jgi:hypothetical protein
VSTTVIAKIGTLGGKIHAMGAGTITAIVSAVAAVIAAAVAVLGQLDSRRSRKAADRSLQLSEHAVTNSGRIANAADQTLSSSSRPIIVSAAIPDEPFKYSTEGGADRRNWWGKNTMAGYIRFPIRNVGVGPAMIQSVQILSAAGDQYDGYSTVAVMAPGEAGLLAYLSRQTNVDEVRLIRSLSLNESITAEISYTGIGAGRRYLTRFVLSPRTSTSDFLVKATEFYECDERGHPMGEPLATSMLPDPVDAEVSEAPNQPDQ